MADKARKQTDEMLAKMERHLAEIYKRANLETADAWKKYLAGVDAEIKPLREAYEAAKGSGDKEAISKTGKALSGKVRARTIMDKNYRNLTQQLSKELSSVNKTAAAYINDQLPTTYAINYNGVGEGIAGAVKGYSFELTDASTVKNLATKDDSLLPYKHIDGRKDVRWNTRMLNAEVLQGVLQGESIPKIAKRLENVTTKNAASAIRNARTAITSAENKGRMDSLHRAAEKGVVVNKVWLSVHDGRVRSSHADLDGQEQEIDKPFRSELGDIMFPGDPEADPANVYNCRCTMTYKVVGFDHGRRRNQDNR